MVFSLAPSTNQPITRVDTPLGTILAGSMSPGDLASLLTVVNEETGFNVIDLCLPSLLGGGVIVVIGTTDSEPVVNRDDVAAVVMRVLTEQGWRIEW